MTNLDIIKHLALNDTSRLAELLDDLYCIAWNEGANFRFEDTCKIGDFNRWLEQDASESGIYYDNELEEWSKLIEKENEK